MRQTGEETAGAPNAEGSRKVVLAALAGNLAIAITKFIAFAFTASTAMLTEGIHSLVDTGDQVLLLVGQRRAARPAKASHPFGYGMETYFWSFIVALMIFMAGGMVAIWEGVEKILHPEPVSKPWVNFLVLGLSAIAEGFSFRTAYREYRSIVRGRNVRLVPFLRASKDPNVIATLLEDGAALAGLALAALGVAGASLLGQPWADGAASVLIGCLLVGVAAFLANETRSLIAGEAAAPIIEQRVRDVLSRCSHYGELESLRTLHLGPQNILVAVGWRFAEPLSPEGLRRSLSELAAQVRAADPRVSDVLLEPARPSGAEPSSSAPGSTAADTAPGGRPARPPAPPA